MVFRTALTTEDFGNHPKRDGVWQRLARELRLLTGEWREERDASAIKRALSRLSDRRLRLIGLCRQTLDEDVRQMIWDTEAGRAVHAELLEILDQADGRSRGAETLRLPPPDRVTRLGPAVELDAVR